MERRSRCPSQATRHEIFVTNFVGRDKSTLRDEGKTRRANLRVQRRHVIAVIDCMEPNATVRVALRNLQFRATQHVLPNGAKHINYMLLGIFDTFHLISYASVRVRCFAESLDHDRSTVIDEVEQIQPSVTACHSTTPASPRQ